MESQGRTRRLLTSLCFTTTAFGLWVTLGIYWFTRASVHGCPLRHWSLKSIGRAERGWGWLGYRGYEPEEWKDSPCAVWARDGASRLWTGRGAGIGELPSPQGGWPLGIGWIIGERRVWDAKWGSSFHPPSLSCFLMKWRGHFRATMRIQWHTHTHCLEWHAAHSRSSAGGSPDYQEREGLGRQVEGLLNPLRAPVPWRVAESGGLDCVWRGQACRNEWEPVRGCHSRLGLEGHRRAKPARYHKVSPCFL